MSHKQFEETKYHIFTRRKAPAILANQVWYDLREQRKLPCLGLKAIRSNIKETKILHCWAEWPPKNPQEWTFNFLNGKTTTRSLAAHGESLPLLWYVALQGHDHVFSAWHVAEVQLILSWVLNCSISKNYIILFSILVPTKLGKEHSFLHLECVYHQGSHNIILHWLCFGSSSENKLSCGSGHWLLSYWDLGCFFPLIPSLSHSEVNH